MKFLLPIIWGLFYSSNLLSQNNIPCDSKLWEHIYHKYRLKVLEECKTVTGIVITVKSEDDGDYHIRLKLDAGQESLLNPININDQHGCLVLEPICVNKVIQSDAINACAGFVNNVTIPEIGQHISATGSYVLDVDEGCMEIHPVTKIEIISTNQSSNRETHSIIPTKESFWSSLTLRDYVIISLIIILIFLGTYSYYRK